MLFLSGKGAVGRHDEGLKGGGGLSTTSRDHNGGVNGGAEGDGCCVAEGAVRGDEGEGAGLVKG